MNKVLEEISKMCGEVKSARDGGTGGALSGGVPGVFDEALSGSAVSPDIPPASGGPFASPLSGSAHF